MKININISLTIITLVVNIYTINAKKSSIHDLPLSVQQNSTNLSKDHQNSHQSHSTDSHRIDETRTIEQLIVDYGYNYTKYNVTTFDHYILTIFRVYNPCLPAKSRRKLDPIILGHPISQDASIFLDGSPIKNPINCASGQSNGRLNQNLGFLLADLGFDVYLPNFRGFRYSRDHLSIDPVKNNSYWDFSFDEMGKYDAPAIVDFVLNQTTNHKVIWIGHSLGVTVPVVLLATQPAYQAKFTHIIGLAPAIFLTNSQRPSTRFLADSGLSEERKYEIGPKKEKSLAEKREIIENRTSGKMIRKLSHEFFSTYGYDPAQTNATRLPVFYTQSTKTSLSTYVHFAQLASSKRFKAFDGGKYHNLRKYNQVKPPVYDLSNIKNVTFTIMYSPNDKAIHHHDVHKFIKKMNGIAVGVRVSYKKLNHFGFLWALNRHEVVNVPIIMVLNQFTPLSYDLSQIQISKKNQTEKRKLIWSQS